MLQPIDSAPASRAPRLAASIRPGPPPVMTAKPARPSAAPSARASCVVGVARRRARRAEDRDGALDLPRARGSPAANSPAMSRTRSGVGGADLGRLAVEPQQELLVERGSAPFGLPLSGPSAVQPTRPRPDAARRRTLRGDGRRPAQRPDGQIPYTVRRSSRARRVRVERRTPMPGVEVVLPARAPEREAAAAIVELRPWIERRLAEARRRWRASPPRRRRSPTSATTLELVAEPGRTRAHRRGETLLVPGRATPARRSSAGTGARRGTRSRRGWTARAPRPGCGYSGLDIRGQRTRWASCSATGRDELQLAAAARARARCSNTSSGTRSATSRSWTTRRASGRCSAATGPAGAKSGAG